MPGMDLNDMLLSDILDSATHTSIIVTDFDGKIIIFNQGAGDLFGYTPEEAKDKSLPELTFSKEDQNAHLFEQIIERVRIEGWTEESLPRRHKSGRIFPGAFLRLPRICLIFSGWKKSLKALEILWKISWQVLLMPLSQPILRDTSLMPTGRLRSLLDYEVIRLLGNTYLSIIKVALLRHEKS
jgi:PAS domain S-box-containing protein